MFAIPPALPVYGTVPRTLVLVPSSIDATGQTDVTSALQSVIEAAPIGAIISFPVRGTYLVERGLMLNRLDLAIMGRGSTLVQRTNGENEQPWPWPRDGMWPKFRAAVILSDCDRIYVHGLHIVGPATTHTYIAAFEEQAGWYLGACRDVTLDSCDVSGVNGDAVSISHLKRTKDAKPPFPCERILVCNSTHTICRRMSVSMTYAFDVTLMNINTVDVGRSVFDIEPPSPLYEVRRVRIDSCTQSGASALFFANAGAGNLMSDIVVINCAGINMGITVAGKNNQPGRRERYLFSGNKCTKPLADGGPPRVKIREVDYVVFVDHQSLVAPESLVPGPNYSGIFAEFLNCKSVVFDPNGIVMDQDKRYKNVKYATSITPATFVGSSEVLVL